MSQDAPPRRGVDPILLLCIVGLTLFGLMMVMSASSVLGEKLYGDAYYYFKHQITFGGLFGLVAFLIGIFVPYQQWRWVALPGMLVALALLVLVFFPAFSVSSGGASRWIALGPITVQPTEITKLAFILYLAALLETKGADLHNWRKGIVPFLVIMTVVAILIVLQPDIGTLFSIIIVAGAMIFAAGIKMSHLIALFGLGVTVFLVLVNTASYRLNRIIVYLHPELDPQGVGYQINQALMAVSTGGWWGLGLGRSRQKYQYLPEPAGDSIFAVAAEELGLVRTSLLLLVFAIIGYRGFSAARRAPDMFGRLVAIGITTWIISQAFINIGSIMAVTPLTGIPLPFISYGGSALVMLLLAAGILLNISRYAQE
ncbi:MAG: putative lipid II flippase FtsW [Candidatus Andersenbacteria bacterium]|nr:putative lipid II flippase FtsW [bacterium]MDZ4225792.1 putative lipid II flippase FtsW [Candidatus Andersenbacteria bacterium]